MPGGDVAGGRKDLQTLYALGFPAYSWFVIHDDLTTITNDKEHRWIILRNTNGEVTVPAFIRSGSSQVGLPHSQHEPLHEPSCRIDEDGRICGQRSVEGTGLSWLLDIDLFSEETYSCREPSAACRSAVEQMYQQSLRSGVGEANRSPA
jgi:hypothetical protein